MTELPLLACSLDGKEQRDRVADWTKVIQRATSREVQDGRIISRYTSDPHLLGELRVLIAAEAECCSFMAFEVQETQDEVIVEVRVPSEMNHVLAGMFGLVTEETPAGSS